MSRQRAFGLLSTIPELVFVVWFSSRYGNGAGVLMVLFGLALVIDYQIWSKLGGHK